jgi:hypothetical protein
MIEWVNKETGLGALYYWLGNGAAASTAHSVF